MTTSPTITTSKKDKAPTPTNKGIKVIDSYLKTLSDDPGVYRMLNHEAKVLYVGKAKNLRKRVENYIHINKLPKRLQRMVLETSSMEFIITKSETEALLLEANLIKQLKPKYNILLRDDKNFSFIKLNTDHEFPGIYKVRQQDKAQNNEKEKFFGPFISTKSIDNTIESITKIFKLRTCSNREFINRTRPCLQFHIKRCSAPCVQKITAQEYQLNFKQTIDFLYGKDDKIRLELSKLMNIASKNLDYEKAAVYRDRLKDLSVITTNQLINLDNIDNLNNSKDLVKNIHIMSLYKSKSNVCIQVLFYNMGRHYGSKLVFPDNCSDEQPEKDILSIFIRLFYQKFDKPDELIINIYFDKEEIKKLSNAINLKITTPKRGARLKLINYALENAKSGLQRKLAKESSFTDMLEKLRDHLNISSKLNRVEVYDNSHLSGSNAIGVMITVTNNGFDHKSYRKFHMDNNISPGDDYEMMYQLLKRRLSGKTTNNSTFPDLIILDGGAGQLAIGQKVLKELNINIPIIGIAKGKKRNAGREKIFVPNKKEYQLEKNDPLLYFLQNIRDESHRFAITSHRRKRLRNINKSKLDAIPGIGPKKKRALLNHFGSTNTIAKATIEDLTQVPGISESLARLIHKELK